MSFVQQVLSFGGYDVVASVVAALLAALILWLLVRGQQGKIAAETSWNVLVMSIATLHAAIVGLLFLNSITNPTETFEGRSMMIAVVCDALLILIVPNTSRNSRAWRSALCIGTVCITLVYASFALI